MKDLKVYSAALVGFSAPGVNWFLDNAEPILKAGVLLGQIVVAIATILYIFSKRKQVQVETDRMAKRRKPRRK